jgi:hypothetical protein
LSIRTEGRVPHLPPMSAEYCQLFAAGGLPQTGSVIS